MLDWLQYGLLKKDINGKVQLTVKLIDCVLK